MAAMIWHNAGAVSGPGDRGAALDCRPHVRILSDRFESIFTRMLGTAVDVTGVILTKLDGMAKGGIVLAVQAELGIPVKLVGVGESAEDLIEFDA